MKSHDGERKPTGRSRDAPEGLDPALQAARLGGTILRVRAHVLVAVMRDLVACAVDREDRVGMSVGVEAGDEERRRELLAGEELEDRRHGDLRRERALREHAGAASVLRITAEPGALRVEVEGERDRHPGAVWPAEIHGQAIRRRTGCNGITRPKLQSSAKSAGD